MSKELSIMSKILSIAQKALNYIWTPARLYITLCVAWIASYATIFWSAYFLGHEAYSSMDILILFFANYYIGKRIRAYVDSKFQNDMDQS